MNNDIVIKANRRHDFADHILDLLAPLGDVRAKRMFSGYGIFLEERMFALIAGQVLYLKCDEEIRPQFQAAGSHAFEYTTRRKGIATQVTLSYWSAPEEVLESRAAALRWGSLALAAARRQSVPKPAVKPQLPGKPSAGSSATRTRAGSVMRKK